MNLNDLSRRRPLAIVVVVVTLGTPAGCRFTAEPSSPYLADGGSGTLDSESASSGSPAAVAEDDASGLAAPTHAAGATSPRPDAGAIAGSAAGAGGATPAGAAGSVSDVVDDDSATDASLPTDSGESASCSAQAVAICDPVANTGCPDAMQCAIDLAAPSMTGYCIFSTPGAVPDGTCLNTLVTESCSPTQTCFEGQCRQLCVCDDDCEEGECCVLPIGDSGFNACGSC